VGVIAVESKRFGGTMHTIGHALDQNREVFAVPGPIGAVSSEGTNRLIQEGAAKLILSAEDVVCELIDRFPGRLNRQPPMEKQVVRQRVEQAVDAVHHKAPEEAEPAGPNKSENPVNYIDLQTCRKNLSEEQLLVLKALADKALRADDLVEATQLPASTVLSALTMLQIQGMVEEKSGKRFCALVRLKVE